MIKKIIFFSFVIVFLNNCGYTPIYSKKNLNFEIETLTTTGEAKVNKILLNKLNIYSDIPNAQRALKLLINSKTTKSTITKDKKGNPTQFSMNLLVTMKITDDKNNTMETKFSESSTYDNSNNKFDLRKYEVNLIKNMTEKIFSEMILFIQTSNP
tara:strand:- start:967 stop:1431 length:465 start_codon:yes stop_codon:yes gene_type:complete